MTFSTFSIAVLMALSRLMGVDPLPAKNPSGWTVVQDWTAQESGHVLRARSSKVVEQCQANPNLVVRFPVIVHSAHEIYMDGQKILTFGDKSFRTVRSFYGYPEIACQELVAAKEMEWVAHSYSRYFARIHHYPEVREKLQTGILITETLNAIAAGALLIIAIFTVAIFRGKVEQKLWVSLGLASLGFCVYFTNTVPFLFGFSHSMLASHKLADLGLWAGTAFYFYALLVYGVCNKLVYQVYCGLLFLACVIISFGADGDVVQFGTTLPFLGTPVLLISCGLHEFRRMRAGADRKKAGFAILSLLFFFLVSVNDILSVVGLADGYMFLSVGFIGGMLFFALSINENISVVYQERDYLNSNLENEVARKTEELQGKTEALELAMRDLKATQGELVQSAKLASLGTLSAGIAHEINNSLNFVYGALRPLENLFERNSDIPSDQKEKAKKLFGVMGDGLRLTFEIIKSLRNFTGLNQAKMNDIDLKQVIETVLTILRNRTKNSVKVHVDMPGDVHVYGSVVGLNQVFMNLVGNAIDAMPDGGNLWISCTSDESQVVVKLKDSGQGIPKDVQVRMFEPFFTTKEVGKGTGLGLHIVRQEIEKHRGNIRCESEPGQGTTFIITFPLSEEQFLKEAA